MALESQIWWWYSKEVVFLYSSNHLPKDLSAVLTSEELGHLLTSLITLYSRKNTWFNNLTPTDRIDIPY